MNDRTSAKSKGKNRNSKKTLEVKSKKTKEPTELRKRAEKIATERKVKLPKKIENMTRSEIEKTLHELLVYQIKLEIQNEELHRTQLELQESKEKYIDLYDSSPVGYLTINEKGIIKEANLTVENLLGVKKGELFNQYLTQYLYEEDLDIFYKHRNQILLKGITQTCELRMLKRNGTQFFAHLESSSSKTQDGKLVCHTVLSDISDHKRIEIALGDAHWRMESILEGAHVGTWEWNVQTGRIVINERWANSLGYKPSELDPICIRTWIALTHSEDRKKSIEVLRLHFKGDLPYYDCEYRIKHKKGNWLWVRIRGSIITRTREGKPLMMFGTHTDITIRKQAEEALREAKWKLESTIVSARVGTWEWNIQTGKIFLNERWSQMIGFSQEKLRVMDIKKWESLIHPDDLKQSYELLEKHFSDELPYYDFECRIKHKNGTWIWIRDRGSVVTRTTDGKPLLMFGTATDITERKQAEEALKLRESHLTAIIENQPGLVWLKDLNGKFLVVNTAFALSRGRKNPKEIIGLTELDLCPKELADRYKKEDTKVIKQKKPLRFEESVFDKDFIKWFETFRRPILDRNGKVIGTTGFKYFQGNPH